MPGSISSNPPAELDAALRVDVRVLGDLLGEILREQAAPDVYETVERIREQGKVLREVDASERDPALAELYAIVEALPPEEVGEVVRAFSLFLTLANTAEQRHKVRERRTAQMRAARGVAVEPRLDSCSDAIAKMIAEGVDPARVYQAASTQHVEFVLTAHPTQVVRRTLLQRYNQIANSLRDGDRKDLTPDEQDAVRSQLRRDISTVWHTDELHRSRPTPTDEVRGGLAVLEQSLWHAVPTFLRRFDSALRAQTGRGLPIDASPIRFGSWMGGDRDGNPNVTARVTREAVFLCRWTAAKLLHDEVDALCQELSMDTATEALRERAGTEREPYRALLRKERTRLAEVLRRIEGELDVLPSGGAAQTQSDSATAATPSLIDALMLTRSSLEETGQGVVAEGRLLDLIRRIHCFGSHMVRLD
ncbi:MAG: phosphoenolpyruvate carboxylase, partial [Polyangiales bacterium]